MPPGCAAAENPPDKPAEALYLQLGQVGLDAGRVYKVRGASLDRSAVHITLEDGTIGFTQDVMGRITGAFFEGDGEILLTPPNSVERKSMSLFTGMAILEEHFATAYFRFNDDAAAELRPDLRATGKPAGVCGTMGRDGAESGANRRHEVADDVQPNAAGEQRDDCFAGHELSGPESQTSFYTPGCKERSWVFSTCTSIRWPQSKWRRDRQEGGRGWRDLLRRVDVIFAEPIFAATPARQRVGKA